LKAPVRDAEAVFIAVGTPSRRGDGHADLTYVYDAAREVVQALRARRDHPSALVREHVEWALARHAPGPAQDGA